MNKFQTELEKARKDAQSLHKQISDNIAKADDATWADVKAAKAQMLALANRMKTLAADQADVVKITFTSAIDKMQVAGKDIEMKASDSIKHTNEALLDSARKAAQTLSQSLAEIRTKAANKIAPKGNDKEVKS